MANKIYLYRMINLIIILIIFCLVFSFLGFYSAIRPPKIESKISPKDLGLSFEQVTFTTSDNINLKGWFIPNKNAKQAKTIVFLHGYPADKGNILPLVAFLNKKYNLFLFDFRYLGESEGEYSTAGALEIKDLLAAIKYLKQEKGINEVGVWGFSMGGAVALMTAEQAPEIKAIISESSYASLDKMINELYPIPLLKYPLKYLTAFWAKLYLKINISEVSPSKSAKKLTIPILVIHSKTDNVIPFSNAKIIQEALKNNSKSSFWFRENMVHGQLGGEYEKRLGEFFDKNF